MEGSPGRFWKGDTNWINNFFVLVVSVRFSINRPVRSRLIEGEVKYKSFPQVVRAKCSKQMTLRALHDLRSISCQLQIGVELVSLKPLFCRQNEREFPF